MTARQIFADNDVKPKDCIRDKTCEMTERRIFIFHCSLKKLYSFCLLALRAISIM